MTRVVTLGSKTMTSKHARRDWKVKVGIVADVLIQDLSFLIFVVYISQNRTNVMLQRCEMSVEDGPRS